MPPTTIVDAIANLVHNPIVTLGREYRSRNRANSMGEALEEYVKDLFAGTFGREEHERLETFERVFSYLGNNSNPPDAMLRGGDAIEVKKIESLDASLALNSSYPKHTLRADSPMISDACRDAERWTERDMLYVVGIVQNSMLRHLAMVYGLDYCASENCYSGLKTRIAHGVNAIEGVDFAPTRELGRINRVDPLGITYMRVRGMWGIENPWSAFKYVYQRDMRRRLNFMCIVGREKWERTPSRERLYEIADANQCLKLGDIRIKNPDNPAKLNDAVLISFAV